MPAVPPLITPIQKLPAATFTGEANVRSYQPAALVDLKVNCSEVPRSASGLPLTSE